MKPEVSIIIVHYKDKEALFQCLSSIKENKPNLSYELIVVDNDEKKKIGRELIKKFPSVKYFQSQGNIGYGAGNNLGAKEARGEFLFILNPDTKILPNSIDNLVGFLKKNKKAALVAPNLVNSKYQLFDQLGTGKLTPIRGVFALSFLNKLFPDNPVSRKYWLRDKPLDRKREVDVVPGSAFLIRKKIYEEMKGFDESFFLYFEESDLCKRIKDLPAGRREHGWKIFIIPEAKIVHFWEKGKPHTKKSKRIFRESRFYYFKKHYGIAWVMIVELFTRFSKYQAILIAVTLLAGFLRFFRIEQNLVFHSELGHNYLVIKNFIESKEIPLLGPPTSHPWLFFGPLFYWIFGPVLWLADYNPLAGAYFIALASLIAIWLNFWFVAKMFDKRIALLSSYLLAISPLWLSFTREARFFSLAAIFVYPFLYFLFESLQSKGKHLFLVGLFLGIMFNFHLTSICLIPVVLVLIYFKRKSIQQRKLFEGISGFFIPQIPFLIYNATHKFEMLSKLFLWLPYRLIGFLGLYPKNTVSLGIVLENLESIYQFFSLSFIARSKILALPLVILIVIYLFIKTREQILKKTKDLPWLTIISWLVFGILALFIHGQPPIHYFLPLFPIPTILLALYLKELNKKNIGKGIVILILVLITIMNLGFFFSDKWFYLPQNKVYKNRSVPYDLQCKVAARIIEDSQGRPFKLARKGAYDYFKGNYAQNYGYLLWWMGNEPQNKASLEYIIYEDRKFLVGEHLEKVFCQGNIIVVKEGI